MMPIIPHDTYAVITFLMWAPTIALGLYVAGRLAIYFLNRNHGRWSN